MESGYIGIPQEIQSYVIMWIASNFAKMTKC